MVNEFYNVLPQHIRTLEGSEVTALDTSTSVVPMSFFKNATPILSQSGRGGVDNHLIVGPIESEPARGITPALWGVEDFIREVRKAIGLLGIIGTAAVRGALAIGLGELHETSPPTVSCEINASMDIWAAGSTEDTSG